MSMITVVRGSGTAAGDPIVDELLVSTAAKVERGRVELDLATPADRVELDTRIGPDYLSGAILEIADNELGAPWRGVVGRVEYSADNTPDMVVQLTVSRPRG